MQLGRSLTTQCLDQVHRRAVCHSISFSTSARSSLDFISRIDTGPAVRASNYSNRSRSLRPFQSRASLGIATCLAFEATSRNQKRYRPWRPEFRKIPKDQGGLSRVQQAGQGVERFLLPANSAPRPAQGGIGLSSDFADAFGIKQNSALRGSDAVKVVTKPYREEDQSEYDARIEQPLKITTEVHIPLSEATTAALEEELQWIARNEPNPTDIKAILTILIQDRRIEPGPRHYEALILANCNPEEGSSGNVAAVLEEMEIDGVDIDVGIYAAALNALAIHPSLPLVWSILSSLQTRWITQTLPMTHALIMIFIRTSQLELANDLLNELHKANKPLPRNQRTPIPKYLYVLFIRALVEKKDYEAVIRWLYRLHDRKAMEMDMPADFWGWVLEHAARDGDGWVTGWLWQDWVEKMKVRPQRETCFDVMQIAARDGVAWLAESVKDVIRHGGFVEASGPETTLDEAWTNKHDDNATTIPGTLQSHEIAALRAHVHKAETSSTHDAGYDENSLSTRACIRLRQAKLKRKANRGLSEDVVNKTRLSEEEESLLDQAYQNSELNLSKKRGFKGLSDLIDRKDGVEGIRRDETSAGDGGEKVHRRAQVKPGNLWPWFKNIEGYGNPRFDPWKALGPKSKS